MTGQGEIPSRSQPAVGVPDPPLPFTGGRIPFSAAERAFVERRVMVLQFVAPALSFVALAFGFALGWPRLAALGVAGLGLTGMALGQFAIREQRLMFIRGGSMTPKAYRYFIYEGVAAVPFGLAIAICGACAVALAALSLLGVSLDTMRDAILDRPGYALVPLGAVLLCKGLGFAIGFPRATDSIGDRAWLELLHFPARLGGTLLIVIGGVALAVGAFEMLQPAAFDRVWVRLQREPTSLIRWLGLGSGISLPLSSLSS